MTDQKKHYKFIHSSGAELATRWCDGCEAVAYCLTLEFRNNFDYGSVIFSKIED